MNDLFGPCKKCSRCGKLKDIDQFYTGNSSYRKMSWCKECTHSHRNDDRAKRPDHYEKQRHAIHRTVSNRTSRLFKAAKRRSIEKSIEFTLTKERIRKALDTGRCEKTGIAFDLSRPSLTSRLAFAPSIDRIDPFVGYTDENVQIVVVMYNLGKGQFTDEQFLEFCRIVVRHADSTV